MRRRGSGKGTQTSDLHFVSHGPQPILLSLGVVDVCVT